MSYSFCPEAVIGRPICPKVIISSLTCSKAVISSPHHPKAVIWLDLFFASFLQLLHGGTSITDCPCWCRENGCHSWVLECISTMWGSRGPLDTIVSRFQAKLPYWSSDSQQVLVFYLCSNQWGVHLIDSASVAARETVWVVASVKPLSGLLPNGGITLLDGLVWGPQFVALWSTLPKSRGRSPVSEHMFLYHLL